MDEPTILYPDQHNLKELDGAAVSAKIARHSTCDQCDCRGLNPPDDVKVVLENSDDAFMVRLNDPLPDHPDLYPGLCRCGHTSLCHGNQDHVDAVERTRRAKVAIRLDELLEEQGKLLDFSYVNDDILGLRKQMKPFQDPAEVDSNTSRKRRSPDSANDMDDMPHAKRRRTASPSPESSDSEYSEGDRPLARQHQQQKNSRPNGTVVNGHPRAGKKAAPGMGLGGPAPSTKAPRPLAPERVFKVESEDVRLDDSQLNRLVNGVAVDTSNPNGSASNSAHPRQEKAATVEQRAGILKIVPVTPDGSPQMKILLTGLKTLFQKQLPKMPREYITRLVFDENSRALAIVKRGLKVVGGITFRPFPHRNFAEIVFFATASVDQVRGYGSMLMNHFKMHIRRTYEGMNHFLTYADNYAVGYFRKQGFTKEISLDRSIWAGYIKDYEGGTLMQCEMLPKVDYLRSKEMLIKQREAILATIRARSRAHIVYEGITNWPSTPLDPKTEDGEESPATALARGALLYPEQIPGLKESRWSFARAAQQAVAPPPVNRTAEEQKMKRLLGLLMQHKMAWPFLQAVNPSEVIDYYNVIKHPMDFGTMEHKLETHRYSTLEAFAGDVRLICENCTTYNDQTTIFHKCATQLGKYFETQLSIMEREE